MGEAGSAALARVGTLRLGGRHLLPLKRRPAPAANPHCSPRARRGGRGGGGGRGRGKRLLNRGMNNGNYIGRRQEAGPSAAAAAPDDPSKVDDHALDGALGFGLFTDGPDRLGWLLNLNTVRRRGGGVEAGGQGRWSLTGRQGSGA